jgi:hypothetical protein
MMVNAYHKPNLLHAMRQQKGDGDGAPLQAAPTAGRLGLVILLLLGACDPVQIVEGSDTHVSVRYDGVMNGLDQATELAKNACAVHGKTAKLRRTYYEGIGVGERFAFFDCV